MSVQKVPVLFNWKHGGNNVVLTGSFDNWKQSIQMVKTPKAQDEYSAVLKLNPYEKHSFKFVVDGIWRCSMECPTESDQNGNVNNWRRPVDEQEYAYLKNSLQQENKGKSGGGGSATDIKMPNGHNNVPQSQTHVNAASMKKAKSKELKAVF
ncbi:hypothetical protein MP228_010052 [Amoeboaphelidium protococcarum]|nr:hypothetical protein MP228_010052 [Amoeboaphelidium protococcarum]